MNNVTPIQWAEALESGNYEQGPYLLRDTLANKFCCLGVLAELLGCEWSDDDEDSIYCVLRKWIEKSSLTTTTELFASYNDNHIPDKPKETEQNGGKSFQEIAAEIRTEIS